MPVTSHAGLAVLALADARFPGGGHVHSGGAEEAITRGLITDVAGLREFLFGRLHGAGTLQAVFAAAAAHAARREVHSGYWRELDAELDARTPSASQRTASRAQGRGTLRAGRVAWPGPALEALANVHSGPHHPLVLGVLAGTAGASPREAALAAGYLSVSGPSSAGVRLLGLDPLAVNAVLAELCTDLAGITALAENCAGWEPADLPSPGAPALDLLAEAHEHHDDERSVRLFAS